MAERERLLAMLHEAVECLIHLAPDQSHPTFEVMDDRVGKFLEEYENYLNEVS